LDYFTTKIQFGVHFVAKYGYDDAHAYLVDTAHQDTRATATLNNLELARNAGRPMTSGNLSYTVARADGWMDLRAAAVRAIAADAA